MSQSFGQFAVTEIKHRQDIERGVLPKFINKRTLGLIAPPFIIRKCLRFMSIGHFMTSFVHEVLKNHRKQSGLAPWWPVCTTFKMVAIRIRKYHNQHLLAQYSHVIPLFIYLSGVKILFLKYLLCLEVIYRVKRFFSMPFINVICVNINVICDTNI